VGPETLGIVSLLWGKHRLLELAKVMTRRYGTKLTSDTENQYQNKSSNMYCSVIVTAL
jgi:hypothetical protein